MCSISNAVARLRLLITLLSPQWVNVVIPQILILSKGTPHLKIFFVMVNTFSRPLEGRDYLCVCGYCEWK